jgi:hypothetical protein
MSHYDLCLGFGLSQLLDTPGETEYGMSRMNEKRQVPLRRKIGESMHHRIIRVITIQQGMKLNAAKFPIIEKGRRRLHAIRLPGIRPHEPEYLWPVCNGRLHHRIVGVKHDNPVQFTGGRKLVQPLYVERDVKERKISQMHMGINDHHAPRNISLILGTQFLRPAIIAFLAIRVNTNKKEGICAVADWMILKRLSLSFAGHILEFGGIWGHLLNYLGYAQIIK